MLAYKYVREFVLNNELDSWLVMLLKLKSLQRLISENKQSKAKMNLAVGLYNRNIEYIQALVLPNIRWSCTRF